MELQRGQASVEWIGALLLVAVVLAGAAVAVEAPWLPRALRCAVLAGCQGEEAELGEAYGDELAVLVRRHAPGIVYERGTYTLPVDFRECRRHWCADAPDRRGADVNRPARGDGQATVFTRVRDWRSSGGGVYIQYWLYYPDSTWNGRPRIGHHEDDWESYQVRIEPGGDVWSRASAHHGYAGRNTIAGKLDQLPKLPSWMRNGNWTPSTGWTRVSRGSHAGHIPDGPGSERRTSADGLRFVPIETLNEDDRGTGFAVTPPWRKHVYDDPEATDT